MKSKSFALTAFIIALLFAAVPSFAKYTLPEIAGAECGELRTTQLETVSGNRGVWLEREYRTYGGDTFTATWMEGSGEKRWFIPKDKISAEDGPLGTGAEYETLQVRGNNAVFEDHPIVGLSLAVKIEKVGTLTVDSQNSDKESLISFAENLIDGITSK